MKHFKINVIYFAIYMLTWIYLFYEGENDLDEKQLFV
jgi:hypothetical protein